MKTKLKYMHTIDGKPATYKKGSQIVYACRTTRIVLADSLAQIRAEQSATRQWRHWKGFQPSGPYSYNLVRV